MKQTAVEWLWDMLLIGEFINDPEELLNQAKAMEKEQIIDACKQCSYSYEEAEQYYNETFKSTDIYECKYCLADKRIHKCTCEYENKTFKSE